MDNPLLVVGLVVLVGMAGCSGFLGADQPGSGDSIDVEDGSPGATAVTQSIGIEVTDSTAGDPLTEVGATYPRDRFVVDAAQHEDIALGVDTDGDGDLEESFNETHISGVNNNAYSFDVTLDTGYTLQSGDVVTVVYPDVDNPTEAGDYTVETRLNGQSAANSTATIE